MAMNILSCSYSFSSCYVKTTLLSPPTTKWVPTHLLVHPVHTHELLSCSMNYYCWGISSHGSRFPFLLRRGFLSSVSAILGGLSGGKSGEEAIRKGMQLFRRGDVQGSLAEFDRAAEVEPRQKAYLWQRGLSLYYLNSFKEGADQFRLDVGKNPNDTEESIWCFLCEAQLYGLEEARKRFLEVGQDPRPVMREAYKLFKDAGEPNKLVSDFTGKNEHEYFYAALYAGLYYESEKENDAAKDLIVAAARSPYAQGSKDYMASLAKVHCMMRGWSYA